MTTTKMKLIGSGAFSKVCRAGKDRYVHIKSDDYVKECMSWGWFPNCRLFPTVKDSDKPGYDYMMPYYPKQSSLKCVLKPREWEKYKTLRALCCTANQECENGDYRGLYHRFSTLKDQTLRRNLLGALDALANYGQDICFEISPRNVAVSPAGNLVLLDCFFIQSQYVQKKSYYFKNMREEVLAA